MRMTVEIPDETYRKLKIKAAGEGSTVRTLILRSIDRELRGESRPGKRVKLPLIEGKASHRINLTREQIDEAMFG